MRDFQNLDSVFYFPGFQTLRYTFICSSEDLSSKERALSSKCFFSLCLHDVSFAFSFLSTRGIKDEICNFDARRITPEMRASVEELLTKNKASFDPKVPVLLCLLQCFSVH